MPILDRFFHSSFYHWAERSHTVKFIGDAALWLWEKSPVWAGTALALVGPYFEGVPWTVAIAAGAILAAALLHIVNQVRACAALSLQDL